MHRKLKLKLFKNKEIFGLVLLILITAVTTSYFNYKKKTQLEAYNNFFDNIYLRKSLYHIIDNLEPKHKKIKHKIKTGETFDSILENYSINKNEIIKIKKSLNKKVNLNKLNTKQIIQFNLDKTNNKIVKFDFQISNTKKIYLKRDIKTDVFESKILSIKLDKKILYKENIILQSLYKAATEQKMPPNTIIEFARIYGFQVDFQRDIRKQDKFQVMYEVYINEKKKLLKQVKYFLLI